jgi:hypothetical protein
MRANRETVRNNLLVMVNEFPEVKKNRNLLISTYWTLFDGAKSLEDLKDCTNAETITRDFRILVSAGRIILEAEVKEALQEKETEYYMEAINS